MTPLSRTPVRAAFAAVAALAAVGLHAPAFAGTAHYTITDDAALNTAVSAARTEYLATRVTGSRLHACLLVKQADGTWKRGSYQGTTNSYPASVVKLPFLAAAMNYARTNSLAYTWLDSAVRPMIEVSDNVQTGVVVDNITGAPNTTTGDFTTWVNKRWYTRNYLNGRGLYGTQNILNKTYPSNSGSGLTGYELQAFNTYGSNQMQPNNTAELMLEVVKGPLEPGARGYMLDMLEHARFDLQSSSGWGVPPGAEYYNKSGWTTTVLNDVAYVRLANNQEFILAVYTDTYATADPTPYHNAHLGVFMDLVIDKAGLNAGGTPIVKYDNADANFSVTGTWATTTTDTDKYKTNYRSATAGAAATATWALNLPETGQYEVQAWWPDGTDRSASAKYVVNHASGSQTVGVDQRLRGGLWVPIGTWTFNAGAGSIQIAASTSTTGKVCADAIRLCKVPGTGGTDTIVDNGAAGHAEVGTWSTSTSAGFYGTNSRFVAIGTGSATTTWTPTLASARMYDVFAWWVSGSNRAADAKYTVHHDGGQTQVLINEQVNGGKWVLLGRFPMTPANAPKVVLTNAAATGSVVVADAVRFHAGPALAATEVIVDNTDAGFAASTNWTTTTATPGYYGANYRLRATASVSDQATWTATIPSAGTYNVFARWTADPNRASAATYSVVHAGGTTNAVVNQQANNGTWVQLGSWTFNPGSATVRLSCWTSSGSFIAADAVRFVKQ